MTRALPGMAVFLVGLVLIWACLILPNYPGIMTADSLDMLCQAMMDRYHDWHSPAMSLVWRTLLRIAPGAGPMLLFIQAAYLAGAAAMALQLSDRWSWRLAILALLTLWPPLFSVLGSVTKDSMFIWDYLWFLTALVWSSRTPRPGNGKLALLLALALLGTAFRTDGVVLFLPGLAWLFLDRQPQTRSHRARWTWAAGMSLAAGLVLLALVGGFNRYVMDAAPRFNLQMTLYYDITGISVRTGENLMPDYVRDQGFDLTFLRERYSPGLVNNLTWSSESRNVPVTMDPNEYRQLKQAWMHAVFSHPLAYLEQRAAFLPYQLDFKRLPDLPIFLTQTDPNYAAECPLMRHQDAMVPETWPHKFVVLEFLPAMVRTPIFRGYIYTLATLLLMVWAGFRRRHSVSRDDALVFAIGAGALLHQAALLVVSAAGLFRYLFPSVLALLVVALVSLCRRRMAS